MAHRKRSNGPTLPLRIPLRLVRAEGDPAMLRQRKLVASSLFRRVIRSRVSTDMEAHPRLDKQCRDHQWATGCKMEWAPLERSM